MFRFAAFVNCYISPKPKELFYSKCFNSSHPNNWKHETVWNRKQWIDWLPLLFKPIHRLWVACSTMWQNCWPPFSQKFILTRLCPFYVLPSLKSLILVQPQSKVAFWLGYYRTICMIIIVRCHLSTPSLLSSGLYPRILPFSCLKCGYVDGPALWIVFP